LWARFHAGLANFLSAPNTSSLALDGAEVVAGCLPPVPGTLPLYWDNSFFNASISVVALT
jgi:hypothetical protein